MDNIERTPENDAIMEHFLICRGTILSTFAQVEWFLAKILIEAHAFPEYAELDLDFSIQADSRVKKIKVLFDADGPLRKYRDDIIPLVEDVMSFADIRNFMAHGVSIATASLQHGILFRLKMFKRMKGGEDHEEKIDFDIIQLTRESKLLSGAGVQFISKVRVIWNDLGMRNFDVF